MHADANSELPAPIMAEHSEIAAVGASMAVPPSSGAIIFRRFIALLIDSTIVGALSTLVVLIPGLPNVDWSSPSFFPCILLLTSV
ncbi:hypothetical protein BH11CYA1_BH11CYA1_05430 [soil metagenome]